MASVVWTPVAEGDLDDILYYISIVDRNPATGERIYYELRDTIQHHATSGLPGQAHPSAPAGWLYTRYKRWMIFYQHREGVLEVMRVIDAVRDLPREL